MLNYQHTIEQSHFGSAFILSKTIQYIGDTGKIVMKAEKEVIAETVEKLVKGGVEREAAEKLAKEEVSRLTKEAEVQIAKQITEKQYDEIAKSGHAVQRHGESITERQLDDRAMYGKDPITGTTDDAFRKDINGNRLLHRSSKDATKFTNKDALVKAEIYVKNSQEYRNALNNANATGLSDNFAVDGIKLEDIFGANYKDEVFGKTRIGSKNNPVGTVETDFTDGTVKAAFKKDANGNWQLETIYSQPKN